MCTCVTVCALALARCGRRISAGASRVFFWCPEEASASEAYEAQSPVGVDEPGSREMRFLEDVVQDERLAEAYCGPGERERARVEGPESGVGEWSPKLTTL